MTTALVLTLLMLVAVVETVQAQSPCAAYTSETGCGGQPATCYWHDGGDVGLVPTCRAGKACGSIPAQVECDAANAFRCKWDAIVSQCKQRSLPSLRSCAPFGIAHNSRPFTDYRDNVAFTSNSTFYASGLEMPDGRAILFGDAGVAHTAAAAVMTVNAPIVVNSTHACFSGAAAFAADIADSVKWDGALLIGGDAELSTWQPRPGIYHMSAMTLRLSDSITFDARGDPSVFWVIRVVNPLEMANLVVHLLGGARPQQVIWVLAGRPAYSQPNPQLTLITTTPTAPVRLVGVFIVTAVHVGFVVQSDRRLTVDGSILHLPTNGFLAMTAATVGGDRTTSCTYFGTDATACLASQTPRCAMTAAGVCDVLDCPATKAQTGVCPPDRCRLDTSGTLCANGPACSLAINYPVCEIIGFSRCAWTIGCTRIVPASFPDTCRDFRVIYNGTDRNQFVLDGTVVSADAAIGSGQLVPFTVASVPGRPGHACFRDAVDFADRATDLFAVSTFDRPTEGEDREWTVVPGLHMRRVQIYGGGDGFLARDATVIFDAQFDSDALFVINVDRLRLGSRSRILLRNGARSDRILWLVYGRAELFGPRLPGTIIAIGASASITTNGAPLTIDGCVVVLPDGGSAAATLILPGAAIGRTGSCAALDGNQAGCTASSLRCAYESASGECHPRPCFDGALTAQTCPLGRCRLATGSVCASGIQCSAARTQAQCVDRYEVWKDCAWVAGACVEAHRRLPDTPACSDYAAVVRATVGLPSRLGVLHLDTGKRRLVTNVLPANFATVTPARNATEVVNTTRTNACVADVNSKFASPSVLEATIPARPVPLHLTASGTGGVVRLYRGTYMVGSSDLLLNATITFDAEGDPAATWIVHTSQLVRFGGGMRIQLANRAQQRNIYWISAQATAGGWVSDGSAAQSSPLLGTFVHLQAATGGIDFRGRKIVGRILAINDNVDLSRAAFVDECYMNANQATCASDTARSCLWMTEQCHAYPTECAAVRGQPTCTSASTLLGFPCVWSQNSTTCAPPPLHACAAFTTESMCTSGNRTLFCQWSSPTGCSARLSLPPSSSSSSSSSDPLDDVLKIAIPVASALAGAGTLVGLGFWWWSARTAKDAVDAAQTAATAALVKGRAARVKATQQQSQQQQQRRSYATLQTISLT